MKKIESKKNEHDWTIELRQTDPYLAHLHRLKKIKRVISLLVVLIVVVVYLIMWAYYVTHYKYPGFFMCYELNHNPNSTLTYLWDPDEKACIGVEK